MKVEIDEETKEKLNEIMEKEGFLSYSTAIKSIVNQYFSRISTKKKKEYGKLLEFP